MFQYKIIVSDRPSSLRQMLESNLIRGEKINLCQELRFVSSAMLNQKIISYFGLHNFCLSFIMRNQQ